MRSRGVPVARSLTVAAAALLLAAGCGSGGARLAGPPTSTSGSLPASSPMTNRPVPVTTGRTMTLTGNVAQGAEPACLILIGPSGSYELQGSLAGHLRVGMQVRVTGHTVRGVASHCMQGTPFTVTSIDSP